MSNITTETFFRCDNFSQAKKQSQGYDDSVLINSLVANIQKNPPWKSLDNKLSHINSRQLELICALLRIYIDSQLNNLKVADVGGGNGYLSNAAKINLPMINWNWTVFESDKITDAYIQFQVDSNLKWKKLIELDDFYDLGLFSCSLQYMKSPFKVLKSFCSKCKYLIIMRLPLIKSNKDVITRQTFNEGIYKKANASFPAWFFSEKNFITYIEGLGEIIYRWKTPTEVWRFEDEDIVLEGMLVRIN